MAENLSNSSQSIFDNIDAILYYSDFLNLRCRQCNVILRLDSFESLCETCIINNLFDSTSDWATITDLIHYLNPDGQDSNLVGNTEDYVIDAEFQTLLQNLPEGDLGTYGGAPPASNSSLENLENFVIDKNHEEEACTICQEIVNGGEVVKKLPCKHVYHDHCITTWLQSRNSCPVCRFELPTDDEEYENKKKRRKLE